MTRNVVLESSQRLPDTALTEKEAAETLLDRQQHSVAATPEAR